MRKRTSAHRARRHVVGEGNAQQSRRAGVQRRPGSRKLKVHADEVCARLAAEYPNATCALRHDNPLELLVATVLSAQCTDARVNEVTKSLFRKHRSARDYAEVPLDELELDIRPTGFYRNKAKSIQAACRKIVERHGGNIPASMEELTALDGVGRKTANVILGTAFGVNEGIVVDTHVRRLAQRLGLTTEDDPTKIEQDLMKLVARDDWSVFAHRLIDHGRRVCVARKPKCTACVMRDICPAAVASG